MSRPIPDHGTNARYGRGCRCDECRPAASAYYRAGRWRRREARAGAPATGITHGAYGYKNALCRCETCVTGHRQLVRDTRAARYAARVPVDGRLVAPGAVRHGAVSTYQNHGCRCLPCTAAQTEMASRRWRDRQRRESA